MKNWKLHNNLPALLFVACFTIMASCRMTRLDDKLPSTFVIPVMPVVQSPVGYDTIPDKQRRLTPQQLRDLIRPYYKDNFDQLLAPAFNDLKKSIFILTSANKQQSESIARLTKTLTSMRQRAIKRTDSTNTVITSLQMEIIALNKEKLQSERERIATSNEGIKKSDLVIKYMITFVLIIFLLVIVAYALGFWFAKYIQGEIKKLKAMLTEKN